MNKITKRLEAAVWNFVYKVCKNALKAYPTTLEEDNELIKIDDIKRKLSQAERNSILYRIGEKRIFEWL